mgnify:FL=1|jgi:TM2 domain-containing membrane protein YozV
MDITKNKAADEMFCPSCGEIIKAAAEICVKCGVRHKPAPSTANNNRMVVALVCWFLGVFGIHRFMTGHVGIGVLQLVTLGMCGIWTLIDFFMLITGSFRDAEGNIV